MVWFLLAIHGCGLALTALVSRMSFRGGLLTAAVAPAVTALWALANLTRSDSGKVYELIWVDQLDLGFRFQTDAVAVIMVAIVSGIGALVFVYAAGYFGPATAPSARFPTTLLAFSASMLGLVLADSVWTLFIFWEFTSVTSFLLVGYKNTDAAIQNAARRALMITGGGGLALLAGLIVLGDAARTTSLSELTPVSGASGTVAALLILAAVATKSAQVPFHVWLPGAMAAPTPVSAYLHSATMVKAGILLMAVTGTAFADVGAWKIVGFAFGVTSMIWGGISALRHRDAKLILAWGTISQLGLLVTLLALGSGKAVFAATSILVAHALFKAALFLVVGEIDVRTGTRNIDELGGLHRTMPIATVVAVLAGLSMAGIPPLLGFVAKEAAVEAVLGLSGTEQALGVIAVVGGSVLTVAYTARFLLTVFGHGPETTVAPRRWAMTVPAIVVSGAGVAGFFALAWVNRVIGPVATELNADAVIYKLKAWPGFTTAFNTSIAIIAAGTLLGAATSRHNRSAPVAVGATMADRLLDSVLSAARVVTIRVQHGSLPVYLATMAGTATVATLMFVDDLGLDHLHRWDHPLQLVLALAIAASALAGAFVTNRLGAALTLGAVGIAMSGLFIIGGAPDLALTQLLIETIVVVGFVVGLGHLARSFPPVERTWRTIRIAVSAAGGLGVVAALVATSARPTGTAPRKALVVESVSTGGGNNIVNVVLTDMRALDTLGEVIVLATVAVGILALASTNRDGPTKSDAASKSDGATTS